MVAIPKPPHRAGGRRQEPARDPLQTWLAAWLTLIAVVGLSVLAGAVVALFSFALWFGVGDFGFHWGVQLLASLCALGVAALLLVWLWRPPSDVAGVELVRADAPELFQVLDRLRASYKLGAIDRVLIGPEMNASVVQLPELGLWGRLNTTLVVGLPLLHSLSPTQLDAILAHELSHLALQRRSLAAWAAQFRAWWHRVLMEIDDDCTLLGRAVAWLLRPHARRYLLASVRLSHYEEFEADAGAAWLVGRQGLAEALIEVALKERYLREEYWDAVMNQFEYPDPCDRILPFRTMGVGVALGFRRSEASDRMGDLLEHAAEIELHPRLIERLAALQVGPHLSITRGPSAADRYLRDVAPGLAFRLDQAWCMALASHCK